MAQCCGYRNILTRKLKRPETLTKDEFEFTNKEVMHKKLNQMAYFDLLEVCNNTVCFGIIGSCLTNNDGEGDVYGAWKKLCKRLSQRLVP